MGADVPGTIAPCVKPIMWKSNRLPHYLYIERLFCGIVWNFLIILLSLHQKRNVVTIMKYPIGIQDFGEVRRDGYAYVDNIGINFSTDTKLIDDWQIA